MKLTGMTFKNINFKQLICLASMLLVSQYAFAVAEGDVKLEDVPEGVVTVKTTEPERNVGYTVGDVIHRTITLNVKKPYALVETSIPIVGYERRWKGKLVGIDVSASSLKKEEASSSTTYTIDLDYQVLTNAITAKPGALPSEYFTIKVIDKAGKIRLFQYRVDSWNFRISPLAVFGAVKIEQDMSGMRGPLVLVADDQIHIRNIAAVILALALLGLLYILGNRAWLPRMGSPFAKALRDIRKLPDTTEGIMQAISRLHLAINKTAEQAIFKGTIHQLVAKKPAFAAIEKDLETFFEASRHVFFEAPSQASGHTSIAWLKAFARRARDCERGLTPDMQSRTPPSN